MGRQPGDRRGVVRSPAREGHRLPLARADALRRRRVRGRGSRTPHRGARGDDAPVSRVVRAHDVHRPDARRAARLRAAGARPARSGARGRPRRGRHAHRYVHRPPPHAHRSVDRRDVLRGRDQEVDLHGHERPPSARGRAADALLRERRRRRPLRHLLRALRHGEDDALGRSRARAHRRRRARLGHERRLQLRGRLLRQGDQALGDGGARDLPHDAHVRDDPRERDDRRARPARPRRRLEDREHARRLQAAADPQRAPREARRPPAQRRLPHRRRVRHPAAARAARPAAGPLLLPLRLHLEACGDGDRDHRAAADVLDVLRRAVPAAAPVGVRRHAGPKARRARLRRLAREHRLDGRAVRRRAAHADRGHARAAARCAGRGARGRRVPQRPRVRLPTSRLQSQVSRPALLDPRSTWSDPETYDRKARELAQMFRDNFEKFDGLELAQAGPRF